MKAKRLIKGFIYLMPIIIFMFYGIFLCTNPFRLNALQEWQSPYDNKISNADYQNIYMWQTRTFENYTDVFGLDFINNADLPLYNSYRDLLRNIGIGDDNDGSFLDFATFFLTYETYAIMICAVLDVLFLIPEFYNKIEDKYIKGGKKRE